VLVLNLLALVGCWWTLVRRFSWSAADVRSLALGAIIVSLAAVHTCLKDGQLTPMVLLGILIGLDPKSGTVRASLGWAVALFKFTIPGPYMALAALRGRKKQVVAVLVAGGIFVAGVAIVGARPGLGTLAHSYGASLHALFALGARDYPATIGEGSASMVWLQALLYRVLSFAPGAVPTLNVVLTAAMVCVLGLVILRCSDDGRTLLIIAAFVLLTSYHRVYDAVLLLPGIAWLIDRGSQRLDSEYLLLMALLLPFLVPGPAVLQATLPDPLKSQWAVYALAIPHQTWCLLAIFIVASQRVLAEALAATARRSRLAPLPLVP
jgi:hypothetical protein